LSGKKSSRNFVVQTSLLSSALVSIPPLWLSVKDAGVLLLSSAHLDAMSANSKNGDFVCETALEWARTNSLR
jgi:hypothetical protein